MTLHPPEPRWHIHSTIRWMIGQTIVHPTLDHSCKGGAFMRVCKVFLYVVTRQTKRAIETYVRAVNTPGDGPDGQPRS